MVKLLSAGYLGDDGDGVVETENLEGLGGGLEVDHAEGTVLLEEGVILIPGGGVGGEGVEPGDVVARFQLGVRLGGAGGALAEVFDDQIQHLFALHAAVDAGEGHDARGHGILQLAVEDLPEVQDDTQKG